MHKPFVVILNSMNPYDASTVELAQELENLYEVPVIPLDVRNYHKVRLCKFWRKHF